MSVAQPPTLERVEAVIISGPRRGQIITLAEDLQDLKRELTPEEEAAFENLQAALRQMAESTCAANEQARALLEDLRQIRER